MRLLAGLGLLFVSSVAWAGSAEVCSVEPGASSCAVAQEVGAAPVAAPGTGTPVVVDLFYAYDCPHCHEALKWLPELRAAFPNVTVNAYEVKKEPKNQALFEEYAQKHHTRVQGVPTFFIGEKVFVGFYKEQTCCLLMDEVREKTARGEALPRPREIKIPFLGSLRTDQISLLQFSVVIGLLDGLNPCAMWVLTFLLSLLIYSRSRRRLWLIGSVFVLASGVVYFGFMSAWLNLFTIMGYSRVVTVVLALVAMVMGLINIKELFFFKKGVSLMISEKAKPKIAARARKIIQESNTGLAIAGTVALALFVNIIELGCTIGLPAIFTKILSDRQVSGVAQYGYMALYNVAYVVPLASIVVLFGLTLSRYRLNEKHGKILKLVSGVLMLGLGLVMLLKPELLVLT